jgi:hypothetical protein
MIIIYIYVSKCDEMTNLWQAVAVTLWDNMSRLGMNALLHSGNRHSGFVSALQVAMQYLVVDLCTTEVSDLF